MVKAVIMPKFGFTQEEANILAWLKQPGESVEQGDPIAEVSTDKVDMEVEAPTSGVLDGILYQEGDTVPVTAVIAYIRDPDETLPDDLLHPLASAVSPASISSPNNASMSVVTAQDATVPKTTSLRATPVATKLAEDKGINLNQVMGTGRSGLVTRRDVEAYLASSGTASIVRAVPAARRLARELGVDLTNVVGSGPHGRVQSSDVRTLKKTLASPPSDRTSAATALPPHVAEVIPLQGIRRTIAQRMQASAREAPHITFDLSVDVTSAEDFRHRANSSLAEGQARVSFTAILARVCAWALRRHPLLNARLNGDEIQLLAPVNIGVAVALSQGLIVPVVRNVDQKGVTQIASEISDLAKRARAGKLRPDDVEDGTFTISNLGMFGVERFTAIINPPQTAILAVGQMRNQAIVDAANNIIVRPMAALTLSADHRVVDGAIVAHFLGDLRSGIEQLDTLIM